MRIVALSDTHNRHDVIEVPDGDVLVHAGDITGRGRLGELEAFSVWWKELPHRHKVIIAGNHDFCFERKDETGVARAMLNGSHYLQDEMVLIEGLKFFGSPWQPWFFGWAFNLRRGPALADKWQAIPEDIDVLVTHGPPQGVLDETSAGKKVGCDDLLRRVEVIKPRLHVFGHIHEAYGVEKSGRTIFANAASCNLSYDPIHPPLVFDL